MKIDMPIYFVIGTRAQFIKVAPLMRKMLDQGIHYQLIFTAQHKENIDEILELYQLPKPDKTMYGQREAQTKLTFLRWFLIVFKKVLFENKEYLPKPGFVLTHGDTFTAWIAAVMGKLAKCKVCHIESGLRSFNIFSPFPEEISRLITFSLSDIYFCPNEEAINNVIKYKGQKINIKANTLLDGVRFAINQSEATHFDFQDAPYALVSLHRYENIFTARLTKTIIPILENIAKEQKLIFTLHPTTRERLIKIGYYTLLEKHPNIILHDRFEFADWINVCRTAEFVITDGGSNQEELFYLGVPTMLFRMETERDEGLSDNVLLTKFDKEKINNFLCNYQKLRNENVLPDISPSQIIIDTLVEYNTH